MKKFDQSGKSIFERSHETMLLIERLRAAEVDEIVPYHELSSMIREDVQRGRRHLLDSAQRALLDEGIVFGAVRDVGVKRLNPDDADSKGLAELVRIKHACQRGVRILSIHRDQPSEESTRKRNAGLAAFGAIAQFSHPKALEDQRPRSQHAIDAGPVTKLFKR